MGETEFIYAHVYNVVCYLYRLFAVNVSSLYCIEPFSLCLRISRSYVTCLLINLKSRATYQLLDKDITFT